MMGSLILLHGCYELSFSVWVAAACYGYYIASFSTQIKQQNRKHKYCDSAHRNAKYRQERTFNPYMYRSRQIYHSQYATRPHFTIAQCRYTQSHRTPLYFILLFSKLKRTHENSHIEILL